MAVCATRIGVVRGSIQETYHNLTANVLSAGNPSSWSMQVLQRANLFESFGDDPEGALGALRKTIQQHGSADRFSDRLLLCRSCLFISPIGPGKMNTFSLRRCTLTPSSFWVTARRRRTRSRPT